MTRNGYTILDVLSDMGGMQRVLFSIFSVVTSVLNYSNFDSYLASKLYKLGDEKRVSNNSEKSVYFTETETSSLKEFFSKQLPKKMLCKSCKLSRR